MKAFGTLVGAILLALKDALVSVLISAVFCFIQWIGSLMSICSSPTWHKFLWGALGVFVVLYVAHLVHALVEHERKRKDPSYRDMNEDGGIDYRTYKEFTKEINKIKNKEGE